MSEMWQVRPRSLVRGGFVVVVGLAAVSWSCAAGVSDPANDPSEGGAPVVDAAAATEDGATDDGASPSGEDAAGDDATGPTPGDDGGAGTDDGGAETDAGPRDARADAPVDAATKDATPADSGAHDAAAPDAAPGHDATAPTDASAGTDATTADAGCSPTLIVVNEVQTSGANGAQDEWVELFNPGSCAVDISGWALKHTSATGTSISAIFTAGAGTTLAANGYGVIAGTMSSASAPTIGAFASGVLADTGGGLALYDANSALIDTMGYGTGASNPFVVSAPAPAEGASQSIARVPNGAKTGNNARDFVSAAPTPGAAN